MPYGKPKQPKADGGKNDWYADAQKSLRRKNSTFDTSTFLNNSPSYVPRTMVQGPSPSPSNRIPGTKDSLSGSMQNMLGGVGPAPKRVVVSRARRANTDNLTFGSHISFFSPDAGGYLQRSDNSFHNQVMLGVEPLPDVSVPPKDFRLCLFEIVPQLKYQREEKRQKEKRQHHRRNSVSETALSPATSLKKSSSAFQVSGRPNGLVALPPWENQTSMDFHKFDRLTVEADAEAKDNKQLAEKHLGKNVRYGDVVQLRHVQSEKFLMFSHRVYLAEEVNSRAYFVIKPTFSNRKEGDTVSVNDAVALCPMEAAEESTASVFLSFHRGGHDSDTSRQLPVVCSGQVSRWRLALYQMWEAPTGGPGPAALSAGDIMWIFFPDNTLFIKTCHEASGKVEAAVPQSKSKERQQRMVGTLDGLWEIELEVPTRGGPIRWDGGVYRLKHVRTGLYLAMGSEESQHEHWSRPAGAANEDKRKPRRSTDSRASKTRLSREYHEQPAVNDSTPRLMIVDPTIDSATLASTAFTLHPASKNEPTDLVVRDSQQFRLQHVETGLSLQRHQENHEGHNQEHNQQHDGEQHSLLVGGDVDQANEEDSLHFVSATRIEVIDGNFLFRALPVMRNYLLKCRNGLLSSGHYRNASIELVLQHLVEFCLTKSPQMKSRPADDYLKMNDPPILRRQVLLRQEGVIDLIIELLNEWSNGNPKLDGDNRGLCRLCYRLMMHMCKDYADNEVYAWKLGHDVFVGHLGHDLGAEETISELLSDNYTLLEDLDPAIVNKCVSLIDTHGKQHHYLEFLASICVCNGEGIPGNQEAICNAIFNHEKVFESVTIAVQCNSDGGLEVEVSGKDEDTEDLVWMSLEEFYTGMHTDAIYFRHLIRLYAMMCFGRMYLCKTQCERLITLEGAFKSMCNEMLPTLVRAAFADFLRHVYVECEPQREQSVPTHLRVWSALDLTVPQIKADMDGAGPNTLPWILPQLKCFIQEYMEHKVAGDDSANPCSFNFVDKDRNTLTLAMLEIYSSLLHCGLFASIPRVQTMVKPLVALLDGRNDDEDIFHRNKFNDGEVPPPPYEAAPRTASGHSKDSSRENWEDSSDDDLEEPSITDSLSNMLHVSVRVARYAKSAGDSRRNTAKVLPELSDMSLSSGDSMDPETSRPPKSQSTNSLIVCRCKLEIAKMLQYISSLWVDLNITCLMKTFRDQFTHSETIRMDSKGMHNTLLEAGSLSSVHRHISHIRWRAQNAKLPASEQLQEDPALSGNELEMPRTWDHLGSTNLVGASQLDLLAIAGEDLTAILLDLTMYSSSLPELGEMALSLLFKLSNPHSSVADEISITQILATPEFLQIYQICVPALLSMRRQVDLAEVWMKEGPSLKTEVVRLNAMFEMLMEVMAPGKDGRVGRERQFLMHNMGTHTVVMDFIRESSYIVSQHVKTEKAKLANDSGPKSKERSISFTIIESGVFQKAYKLLELFCRGNLKHQMLLHGELERFTAQLGAAGAKRIASLGQNQLIAAIFHSNKQLCSNVKADLIKKVSDQITLCGPLQVFLTIPRTIVMCNGSYIRANQDLIMQYLVGSADDDGVVGAHLSLKILRTDSKAQTEFSEKESQQQLSYEASLCDLLSECCCENVMAQLKSQALLPFEVVRAHLLRPDVSGVHVMLRRALLKFLLHVYLENDTQVTIGSSSQWLELWHVQRRDMSALATLISSENWVCTDETEFLRDPAVRESRPHEKRAWAKVDCFLSSFLPVLLKFLQIWDMELRVNAAETRSFHNFVKSIIMLFHELLCGNDWVLPLVIAHDLMNTTKHQPSCCSQHASSVQIQNIGWVHSFIQQVCVEDVVLDKEHRQTLETLQKDLERSVVSANSEQYTDAYVPTSSRNAKIEAKPGLVVRFEKSFEELQKSTSWRRAEKAEFDFLIRSVCLGDQFCGKCSYASMTRLINYLIDFLHKDKSITLWTSISCLRLIEGIVMSDYSLLEKATGGISQTQQKKLTSLCFDILGNRLGCDAVFEKAGLPTNPKVLRHVLGVANALLSGKKGGNTFVQQAVHDHLKRDENAFVAACKRFLKRSMKDFKTKAGKVDEDLTVEELSIAQNTLRLLQLMCEGHFKPNQDYLRDQGVHRRVDLVSETADYFGVLWRYKKNESTVKVMIQALDTLTEFVQGPCRENQDSIVNHGFLADALSVLSSFGCDCFSLEQQESLKDKVAITMQALLECRHDATIHESVKKVVVANHEIIKENMLRVYMDFLQAHNNIYHDECEPFPMTGRARDSQGQSALSVGFSLFHLIQAGVAQDQSMLKEFQPKEKRKKNMIQKYFSSNIFTHSITSGTNKNKRPFTTGLVRPTDLVYFSPIGGQCYAEAWEFFRQHSASVEVVLADGALVRIQFPKPPMCHFLSKESKKLVEENIRRRTPTQRVSDIFAQRSPVLDEMDNLSRSHWKTLKIPVLPWVLAKGSLFQSASFVIAVCLNLMLVASFRGSYHQCVNESETYVSFFFLGAELSASSTATMMKVFGFSLIITSGITYASYAISHGTLICIKGLKKYAKHVNKRSRKDKKNKKGDGTGYVGGLKKTLHKVHKESSTSYFWLMFICGTSFLADPQFAYFSMHFAMSILAMQVNPLFYAIHLAGIFLQFPELQRVLDSVLKPGKVLTLTFVLFIFLCYAFSLVGYIYFSDHYPMNACDDLVTCFRSTIDQGFKNDGGIGGSLTSIETLDNSREELARFLFDHLFNVLLLILLLNIVFGVVIDTFAAIRNQSEKLHEDKSSNCTVCSCSSSRFENVGRGFDYHIKYEHNMWDYYALFAYLIKKDPLEFTGIESYLSDMITARDPHSIFPTLRSIVLDAANDPLNTTSYDDDYEAYDNVEYRSRVDDGRLTQLTQGIDQLARQIQRLEKIGDHHDHIERSSTPVEHEPPSSKTDLTSPLMDEAEGADAEVAASLRGSNISTASEF